MSDRYDDGLDEWVNDHFKREISTYRDVEADNIQIRLEYRAKEPYKLRHDNADEELDGYISTERQDLKHVSATYVVSRAEVEQSDSSLFEEIGNLLEDGCMAELNTQYRTWVETPEENTPLLEKRRTMNPDSWTPLLIWKMALLVFGVLSIPAIVILALTDTLHYIPEEAILVYYLATVFTVMIFPTDRKVTPTHDRT